MLLLRAGVGHCKREGQDLRDAVPPGGGPDRGGEDDDAQLPAERVRPVGVLLHGGQAEEVHPVHQGHSWKQKGLSIEEGTEGET